MSLGPAAPVMGLCTNRPWSLVDIFTDSKGQGRSEIGASAFDL